LSENRLVPKIKRLTVQPKHRIYRLETRCVSIAAWLIKTKRVLAILGILNVICLNTGPYLWKIPLGETSLPNQKKRAGVGCQNHGCLVVTSNGLLFIVATKDGKRRVNSCNPWI
jgi:hypothetical protein